MPGQSFRYDWPSQSPSEEKQPLILTSEESVPGTQPVSSSSSPLLLSCAPGVAQLKFASRARQFSKWPISSEKATL